MPELPDIVVYCEALEQRMRGQAVDDIRVDNPFVLRTAVPPLASLIGQSIRAVDRLGKRIVFRFDDELYLVIHLMIAGRLKWEENAAPARAKRASHKAPPRGSLARVVTAAGTLRLVEAGTTRRASVHVVQGAQDLNALHRGGLEVMDAAFNDFSTRVTERNHTLKRVLTDPSILSGIGNAYSDEILHRARLSPILQSQKIDAADIERLYSATIEVLREWTDRLRCQVAASKSGFPEKVTAFRREMAVHGRFGEPCPVCQAPVQRIRYATNETNYCARCQTAGVILKDRSLSRLLKNSWPRSLDD